MALRVERQDTLRQEGGMVLFDELCRHGRASVALADPDVALTSSDKMVAAYDSLEMRLLGISLASFSSGASDWICFLDVHKDASTDATARA